MGQFLVERFRRVIACCQMSSQADPIDITSSAAQTDLLPLCKLKGCNEQVWRHVDTGKTEDYCRAAHAIEAGALRPCEFTLLASLQASLKVASDISSTLRLEASEATAVSPSSPPAPKRSRSTSPATEAAVRKVFLSSSPATEAARKHRSRTPDPDASPEQDF